MWSETILRIIGEKAVASRPVRYINLTTSIRHNDFLLKPLKLITMKHADEKKE